jgi:glycogen operon protein
MQVWPGHRYPLGATYDGTGTNFAIFSEGAEAVELCLFDPSGNERKVQLHEQDAFVWHAYLPGVEPGQRYGYRVYGPYDPSRGLRYNPHKLLLDPYARAVDADIRWHPSLYAYDFDNPDQMSDLDSAPYMAKGVVVNPYFDWGNDRRPDIPYHHSVIYETHVKGLTERHPEVPKDMRGSYSAIGHPAIIEHLKGLGVTAVELMPVHQFVHDNRLHDLGLRNYWGYNTLGFFAPYQGYSSTGTLGQQTQEFRGMVKALHKAGMEVILDVVYNHTAEGNHLGPTMSLKGIDNRTYYRLVDDQPQFYMDYTGTGNSLNVRSPQSLQLIMDSLRYWVTEMHVDGFRFDLASTLAREFYDVDRLSTFFEVVQQDPVVGQVKLIAEPWDVGPGGYQVGNFPPNWTEWNGKYRDTVRDFWRGEPATLAEFASRITGSADLYQDDGRKPFHSINFVTAHDGFTLTDLVSYNDKHNEANGEGNRDGESHNRSWNSGTEGPATDPQVLSLRAKQRHPDAQPGRADDLARRRDGPHPAGQQQRVLPGQRDRLGRLGERRRGAARVHPQAHRVPPPAPGVPAPPVLHRAAGDRARRRRPAARPGVVHPGRAADGRRRLGQRLRPGGRAVRQRRGHPGTRPVRPAARGQLVPAVLQRARRAHRVRHPAGRVRREVGKGHRNRRAVPGSPVGRGGRHQDLGAGPLAHRARQDGLNCPLPVLIASRSAPTSRSAPPPVWPTTWPTSASATSTPLRCSPRSPARTTATTWSTTARSTRSWAAPTGCGRSRRR